jgi:hypothetical protein
MRRTRCPESIVVEGENAQENGTRKRNISEVNTETECNEEKSSDVKPNVEGTKTEGKVDKQTVRPRRQRGKHRTSQFTLIGFARYVFTKLTLFFQASKTAR